MRCTVPSEGDVRHSSKLLLGPLEASRARDLGGMIYASFLQSRGKEHLPAQHVASAQITPLWGAAYAGWKRVWLLSYLIAIQPATH